MCSYSSYSCGLQSSGRAQNIEMLRDKVSDIAFDPSLHETVSLLHNGPAPNLVGLVPTKRKGLKIAKDPLENIYEAVSVGCGLNTEDTTLLRGLIKNPPSLGNDISLLMQNFCAVFKRNIWLLQMTRVHSDIPVFSLYTYACKSGELEWPTLYIMKYEGNYTALLPRTRQSVQIERTKRVVRGQDDVSFVAGIGLDGVLNINHQTGVFYFTYGSRNCIHLGSEFVKKAYQTSIQLIRIFQKEALILSKACEVPLRETLDYLAAENSNHSGNMLKCHILKLTSKLIAPIGDTKAIRNMLKSLLYVSCVEKSTAEYYKWEHSDKILRGTPFEHILTIIDPPNGENNFLDLFSLMLSGTPNYSLGLKALIALTFLEKFEIGENGRLENHFITKIKLERNLFIRLFFGIMKIIFEDHNRISMEVLKLFFYIISELFDRNVHLYTLKEEIFQEGTLTVPKSFEVKCLGWKVGSRLAFAVYLHKNNGDMELRALKQHTISWDPITRKSVDFTYELLESGRDESENRENSYHLVKVDNLKCVRIQAILEEKCNNLQKKYIERYDNILSVSNRYLKKNNDRSYVVVIPKLNMVNSLKSEHIITYLKDCKLFMSHKRVQQPIKRQTTSSVIKENLLNYGLDFEKYINRCKETYQVKSPPHAVCVAEDLLENTNESIREYTVKYESLPNYNCHQTNELLLHTSKISLLLHAGLIVDGTHKFQLNRFYANLGEGRLIFFILNAEDHSKIGQKIWKLAKYCNENPSSTQSYFEVESLHKEFPSLKVQVVDAGCSIVLARSTYVQAIACGMVLYATGHLVLDDFLQVAQDSSATNCICHKDEKEEILKVFYDFQNIPIERRLYREVDTLDFLTHSNYRVDFDSANDRVSDNVVEMGAEKASDITHEETYRSNNKLYPVLQKDRALPIPTNSFGQFRTDFTQETSSRPTNLLFGGHSKNKTPYIPNGEGTFSSDSDESSTEANSLKPQPNNTLRRVVRYSTTSPDWPKYNTRDASPDRDGY